MKRGKELDRQDEQAWGFVPPDGEEWPPQVALTAQAIIRQQSNPFFATLMDTASVIHHADGGPDPDIDYIRMLGMVELLTELVTMYCWSHLLPDEDYVHNSGELEYEKLKLAKKLARAVAGELLLHVSKTHGRSLR